MLAVVTKPKRAALKSAPQAKPQAAHNTLLNARPEDATPTSFRST
jgi:hypothetical protein